MNKILFILLIIQILLFIVLFVDLSFLFNKKDVNKINSDIVISLTTIPQRLNNTEKTILSILNGSVKPEKIIFNIPYKSLKGKDYDIPEWLNKLSKDNPFLILNRCQDYGPSTKIIPTLLLYKNEPEKKIIYIDDDLIYHQDFLRNFIRDYKDDNCVLARRGYNVKLYQDICGNATYKKIWSYRFIIPVVLFFLFSFFLWLKFGLSSFLFFLNASILIYIIILLLNRKENVKDIVMGCAGVLVKPKFFNLEKLVNYRLYPKEVVHHDDIYLSGHLRENGVKCIVKGDKSNIENLRDENALSSTVNFDETNRCVSISSFNWKK